MGVCEGFCWFDGGGGAGGEYGVFLSGVLGWGGEGMFEGFVGWRVLSGVEGGSVCKCAAFTRMCGMMEGAVWSCRFHLLAPNGFVIGLLGFEYFVLSMG